MELPNSEHFSYRACRVAGEDCWLINPKVSDGKGVWTPDNLRFRSVILRISDNLIISQGFSKFYNFGQQTDLYPNPLDFDDWDITEKMDGSLICYSKHNGHEIIRTRGASSVDIHDTGQEIKDLINNTNLNQLVPEGITILMEHTTCNRTIVIKYKEPKLTLLGVISNITARYFKSSTLPILANQYGLDLPKTYKFNSIGEIVANCETLKGMEGYVLSFGNNQYRIKLKGTDYLLRHRLKSNFDTIDHVLDYWFSIGKPDYNEFYNRILEEVDFETAEDTKHFLIKIQNADMKLHNVLESCFNFAQILRNSDRKAAAHEILNGSLKQYSNVLFNFLDGRQIDDKTYRKLMESLL